MASHEKSGTKSNKKRLAAFHSEFLDDLRYWVKQDPRIALKVIDLIEAVMREPFFGAGKPEPLKHVLAGTRSRRLTLEHRIVYLVSDSRIDFLQARYHY